MTRCPTYAQVVPFPLGTGNDMSRVLGWGANYAGEPIVPLLEDISAGQCVQMDRWMVHSEPLQDSDVECLHVILNSCERLSDQDCPEKPQYTLASPNGKRHSSASERTHRKKALSFSGSDCVIPSKPMTPPPSWVNKSGSSIPSRDEKRSSSRKRSSKKSKRSTIVHSLADPLPLPPSSQLPLDTIGKRSSTSLKSLLIDDLSIDSQSGSQLEGSVSSSLDQECLSLAEAVQDVDEEDFNELSGLEKRIDEHLESAEGDQVISETLASHEVLPDTESAREPRRKVSKRTKLLHPKGDTSLPVRKPRRNGSKRRAKTTMVEPADVESAEADLAPSAKHSLSPVPPRLSAVGLSSSAGSLPEYTPHSDGENSPQGSNSRLETSTTHKKRLRMTSDAEKRRRSKKSTLNSSSSSLPSPSDSPLPALEGEEEVSEPVPAKTVQPKMSNFALAKSTSALSYSLQAKASHKALVMNNYFSVGVDSMVALDFHLRREQSPGLFPHHVINKAWYGIYGLKHAMLNLSKKPDLRRVLRLTLDGSEIEIPRGVEAIVFLQIPSYSSGTNLWGDYTKTKGQSSPPSVSDGIFEVVALKGVMHLGALQAGWSSGIRLGQAKEATLHTVCVIPAQCDGEPWLLPACKTTITFYKQSTMLFNLARTSAKRYTTVTGLQPPASIDPESELARAMASTGKSDADSSENSVEDPLAATAGPSSSGHPMLTNTPVTPNELRQHIRRVPSRQSDLLKNTEDFPKRVLASRRVISSPGSRSAPESSVDSDSHSTDPASQARKRADSNSESSEPKLLLQPDLAAASLI